MKLRVKILFEEAIGKDVRTSRLIEEGFCNENYEINNAYVLRLTKPNEDETIDRAHEKLVYKAIEPLKISENVLYFDEKTGTQIAKMVHSAIQYAGTPTELQINLVAKNLKKLHNSGIEVPFGYQMFLKLKKYKSIIDPDFYLDEKIEKKIIKEVQKIFA